jgi:hypothetical protein
MRRTHRLSPLRVKKLQAGMHADGAGLYLQATRAADGTINRSWIFRYVIDGREHHMGLGSTLDVTLAEAREKAADARKLKAQARATLHEPPLRLPTPSN